VGTTWCHVLRVSGQERSIRDRGPEPRAGLGLDRPSRRSSPRSSFELGGGPAPSVDAILDVQSWPSFRPSTESSMVRVTGEGARAAREFYETVIRISYGTAWGEGRHKSVPEDAT
jgi:hypothetical protein